jgi:hypothetical protein
MMPAMVILFKELAMNAKLILAVAILSIGLGASNVSNADTRRGQDQYYDSPKFGLSLHFGSRSRPIDNSRYGYSNSRRNDNRYYDNRSYNNRYYNNRSYNSRSYNYRSFNNQYYDNRSYRSNNYCPDYGIIYYSRLNRGCFSHGNHYHCD